MDLDRLSDNPCDLVRPPHRIIRNPFAEQYPQYSGTQIPVDIPPVAVPR